MEHLVELLDVNIKAWSVPLTDKTSLTTSKQAGERDQCGCEETEDECRGEKGKWSFIEEALWGFILPLRQATEH